MTQLAVDDCPVCGVAVTGYEQEGYAGPLLLDRMDRLPPARPIRLLPCRHEVDQITAHT